MPTNEHNARGWYRLDLDYAYCICGHRRMRHATADRADVPDQQLSVIGRGPCDHRDVCGCTTPNYPPT